MYNFVEGKQHLRPENNITESVCTAAAAANAATDCFISTFLQSYPQIRAVGLCDFVTERHLRSLPCL